MRVLHPLRAEETLLGRGRYRYLRSGKPTGDVETWYLTRLPDGSEVVRADLDARKSNGMSLVTHLHRPSVGCPNWLRLRYFGGGLNTAAQYSFEEDSVRVARMTSDFRRQQEVVELAAGYVVNYHLVISSDYVWRGYPAGASGESRLIPVFSPDLWAEGDRILTGRALRVSIQPLEPETCLTPAGRFEGAQVYAVSFDDGVEATAWYDQQGMPLRWHYPAKGYEYVLIAYETGDSLGT